MADETSGKRGQASKFKSGGFAKAGLFANISSTDIQNLNLEQTRAFLWQQAEHLVQSGKLRAVGEGGSSKAYEDTTTGQIYRIGLLSEQELRATVAAGSITPKIGSHMDLEKSLYIVKSQAKSSGVGVVVMEKISGQSLHDFEKTTSPEEARKLLINTAKIIGRMHYYRIIHGDLKNTKNIIVNSKGEPRIIDYQAAQKLSLADPEKIFVYYYKDLGAFFQSAQKMGWTKKFKNYPEFAEVFGAAYIQGAEEAAKKSNPATLNPEIRASMERVIKVLKGS